MFPCLNSSFCIHSMLNLTSADSSAPALHALTCKWIRTWNENDPLSTCVKAEGAPSQMFTPVAAISALIRSIAKPNHAWKDLLAYRSHIPHLVCFPLDISLQKPFCHVRAKITKKKKKHTVLISTTSNLVNQVKHFLNLYFVYPSGK